MYASYIIYVIYFHTDISLQVNQHLATVFPLGSSIKGSGFTFIVSIAQLWLGSYKTLMPLTSEKATESPGSQAHFLPLKHINKRMVKYEGIYYACYQ